MHRFMAAAVTAQRFEVIGLREIDRVLRPDVDDHVPTYSSRSRQLTHPTSPQIWKGMRCCSWPAGAPIRHRARSRTNDLLKFIFPPFLFLLLLIQTEIGTFDQSSCDGTCDRGPSVLGTDPTCSIREFAGKWRRANARSMLCKAVRARAGAPAFGRAALP